MAWLIDDIDLSTLAWNISNRSAGWTVPAKRGDNLVIPGRHGTQWVANKPFDEGSATLNMWALGSNPDGSMPTDGNLRRMCRYNLDKLTAIFGQSSRLLNVIQVESSAYGAKNMATNPSFETKNAATNYTYQNSILNPAGRKTASTPLLTNLFPNPAMATTVGPGTWFQRFENLFPDPSFQYQKSAGDTIGSSNYVYPSSFESTAINATPDHWSTGAGTAGQSVSLVAVAATSTDQAQQPYGGTKVLRMTTSQSTPSATFVVQRDDPFYVGVGHFPAVSFWLRRSAGSVTGTFNLQVRMFNFQADQTTRYNYSDYFTVSVPASTTAWSLAQFTPTGGTWTTTGSDTDYVGFEMINAETWPANVSICFDQFACMLASGFGSSSTALNNSARAATLGYWDKKAGPFYNGDSAWGNLTGAGETGLSRWNANVDTRWIPDAATNASSAYYTFADRPATSSVLNFIAMGFTAGQTQGFNLPLAAPTAGHTYVLRFQARAAAGKSISVKLLKQGVNDPGQVTVATSTFTGSGTPVATGSRMSGTINDYAASGTYTAQAGDQVWMRVEMPSGTDGFPILQLLTVVVEDSHPFYFGGDSTNSTNSQYSWASTQYNSKSILKQLRVSRLATAVQSSVLDTVGATNVPVARSTCAYTGQVTQLVTENTAIPSGAQGFWVTAQCWGDVSAFLAPALGTAQAKIEFLNSAGDVLSTATSTSQALNAVGSTKNFTIQVSPEDVPVSATQWRVTVLLINPQAGQILDLVNLLVSPLALNPTTLGAPIYFDGSTSGASWTSTANNSTSTFNGALPTNWTASPGVLIPGSGICGTSPIASTTSPQVVLTTPLGSASVAGTYLVGLNVQPKVLNASGVQLGTGDVQVLIQALTASGTSAGLVAAGVVGADSTTANTPQYLQGIINTSAAFTSLAFWFISPTGVSILQASIAQAYLMPISNSYTNVTQRLDFNSLYNPQLIGGSKGWNAGSASLVSTLQGNGLRLASASDKVSTQPVYIGPLGSSQTVSYGAVGFAGAAPLAIATRAGTVRQNMALDPGMTGSRTNTPVLGATISYDSKGIKIVSGGNAGSSAYVEDSGTGATWAQPSQTYTISANWHTDSSAPFTGVVPQLTVVVSSSTFASSQTANPYDGDGRLAVTFTLPASFTNARVRLMNASTTNGATIWWDNLLIEQTPGATTTSEVVLATNNYPDPYHAYGWGPFASSPGVPTSGAGVLALDSTFKHSTTGQSIKFTNMGGNTLTNPVTNPDGGVNTYWATAPGTGGAATAAYGGGYAEATWTAASTTSSGFTYSNATTAFDPGTAAASGDTASASLQVWVNRAMSITFYRQLMQGSTQAGSVAVTVAIPANTWTEIRLDAPATAPAGVDHVRFLIYNTAGMNVGDILRVRYLTLVKDVVSIPAFSGATAGDNFTQYAWSGAANASASTKYQPGTLADTNFMPVTSWNSSLTNAFTVYDIAGNTNTLAQGSVYQGKPTIRVTVGSATTSRLSMRTAAGLTQTYPNLQAGHVYWLTFDLFVSANAVGDNFSIIARDDPNADSGAGTVTYPVGFDNGRGGWIRAAAKITVNAGRTVTGLYFTGATGVSPVGAYAQIGRIQITETDAGSVTPPTTIYDGDTVNNAADGYMWLGAQDASPSVHYIRSVQAIYKTGNSPGFPTPQAAGIPNGQTLTLSAWVYVPSGSEPYASQDYVISLYGNGLSPTTVYGSAGPVRDGWQKVSCSATVADNTQTYGVRLWGPYYPTDTIWYSQFAVEVGTTTTDFSGDSGSGYRWVGPYGSSASQRFTAAIYSGLGSYFDGATPDSSTMDASWDGTTNNSTSTAFFFTETARASLTGASSAVSFGTFALPTTATHAALAFTGNGATVTSAYLAQPSGAETDSAQVDPTFFPYFDGSSGVGPYGGAASWAGTVDGSVSRVVPDTPTTWGVPTSPITVVPHMISANPPAGSLMVPTRPTGGSGSWAIIPRQLPLNVAKLYRLNPAIAAGPDDLYLSGQILARRMSNAVIRIDLMMASSPTATGVSVWNAVLTGSSVQWLNVPITAAYYYIQVSYTETVHAAGYRCALDDLLMMPTSVPISIDEYPGYFDGSGNGAAWDGDPDNSTSSYFGGGRRAYAEVREAIDMSSMAGGTRAEFAVSLAIPGAFWEDLLESTITQAVTNAQLHANTQFPLTVLVEGTAPIDDAVITVTPTGTVTGLVLTDVATGATLALSGNVPSGGVVFDCGNFTAMSGSTSVIRNVTRAGSNGFLPLTPVNSETPPTLAVAATGTGSLTFNIIARRRYLIA